MAHLCTPLTAITDHSRPTALLRVLIGQSKVILLPHRLHAHAPKPCPSVLEPQAGLEPASLGLQNRLPTNWATAACAFTRLDCHIVGSGCSAYQAPHCHTITSLVLCTDFRSASSPTTQFSAVIVILCEVIRNAHISRSLSGLWWTLIRSTPEATPAFNRPGNPHGDDRQAPMSSPGVRVTAGRSMRTGLSGAVPNAPPH